MKDDVLTIIRTVQQYQSEEIILREIHSTHQSNKDALETLANIIVEYTNKFLMGRVVNLTRSSNGFTARASTARISLVVKFEIQPLSEELKDWLSFI